MKKYLTLLIIGSFLLSGCESSTTFDKSSVVAEITLYRKYDGLSQDLFKEYIKLSNTGNIITDENMQTNIKGVYAAGDVREKAFRQIATAISDGAIAALMAEKYINEQKGR